MRSIKLVIFSAAFVVTHMAICQEPVAVQRNIATKDGLPSSGGYTPPELSLTQMLESNSAMSEALMTFLQTGDQAAYRAVVLHAAQRGEVGAELLLAEQYIPEQCTFQPDQDAPHCGKNGDEPPHVVFRTNPLGIEASYENASLWLEKASAHGSGEASEVLAQLITRMQANGHVTHYSAKDATRLHASARSQGFDVESILVTCYKLIPGERGITVGRIPGLVVGQPPPEPFSNEELASLGKAGVSGSLLYEGGGGGGDSVLLMRPEGPTVRVRIILDHDPGAELLLPMPAHHDVIYLQRGEQFLSFPSSGKNLSRFVTLESRKQDTPQVLVSTQQMDGGHSGGGCAEFP